MNKFKYLMIKVLDYGAGNLLNIYNALNKITSVEIVQDLENMNETNGLVIPGVGAFDTAMLGIKEYEEQIKNLNIPVLGICLGLQIMASRSEESEKGLEGLNLISGDVVRFRTDKKVPHMGWNSLIIKKTDPLLEGINTGDYFYFVHSYHLSSVEENNIIASTEYDYEFPSIIKDENFYAVQFHPERSGVKGLELLKNFVRVSRC